MTAPGGTSDAVGRAARFPLDPKEDPSMSAKVQVIFYSTYGHVYRLAEAVAEGARAVAGSDVQVLQVAETLPADVLEKMGATEARKAFAHVPVADPRRLVEADAIILGTT